MWALSSIHTQHPPWDRQWRMSWLLLCCTIAMSMFEVTAGIVLVKSHHKLREHRNHTCAHAWKEMGRLQRQPVFGWHRGLEERWAEHLVVSKLWLSWRVRILISGSICWVIQHLWNGFCSSCFVCYLFKFPYPRKHSNEKHQFWGKNLRKQKNFLMFLNYRSSLLCTIHRFSHEFIIQLALRGWSFKTSRMKSVLEWEVTQHDLAENKILWFRYVWLKK